jgi:signal transduction histidine kinase
MSRNLPARVLLVDDNRVNRRVLETKLSGHGYNITSAKNGREALDFLMEEEAFDIVLLDVMMPEMDGMEVLRHLREKTAAIELPVIMVTSKSDSDDLVDAFRAGANDYVTKPIDYGVLFVRMETHLNLKETHRSLRLSQLALIHAAKMESVGYLAAGLAHEIRNPLAQIQMSADALRRELGREARSDSEKLERLLGGIETSVQRADEIVLSLQKASRSGALDLKSTFIGALVSEVIDLLSSEIEAHGVNVNLEAESDHIEALCAIDELRQVLMNGILNAIQAMPNGGDLKIRIYGSVADQTQRSEGNRSAAGIRPGSKIIVIEVADTGCGMPVTDLPRAFDPFFTSRATGTGTGLGLTVAQKLMELQGGRIDIHNQQQGSGLIVRLMLQTSVLPFM